DGRDGPAVHTTWTATDLTVHCPQTKLQGLVVAQNADVTGNLKLKGEDIEGWLANSDVYTFAAGPLTVPKPACPTGSPNMAASVMSYEATDVRKQEVISTPLAASWTVELKLTVGNPAFNLTGDTDTNTNPSGAKLLVQTWCS
ncbi:MAG: hypothetical protein ACK5PT_03270, partial [Cereibacter sp.]